MSSATQSASVYPLKRNLIFSVPSSSAQFSRTLFSAQKLVSLIMTMQRLRRTLDAPTQSNTSRTLRFLVYRQATPAISFSSLVTPEVSCHPFLNLTRLKPCSTSSPVTPQRWLVQKMVSRSHKQPSRLALPNHSWLCTPCATLRCWLIRLSNIRPMHGC